MDRKSFLTGPSLTDSPQNRPGPVGTTSLTLISRLQQDDPIAWERFVHLYGPVVRFWIRQYGIRQAHEADVFQEVFVAVRQQIPKFVCAQRRGSTRRWLKMIVRGKSADHFRGQGRIPVASGGTTALRLLAEVADAAESESSASDVDTWPPDEKALLVRQIVGMIREEFSDRVWQSFWRTEIDNLNASEAATELGISAVAVRTNKSRVRRRVREALEEAGAP